ncbi:phosphatidate cytidylyltransferase [Streptococcus sp. 121]|uniref:phosphatidate cytidylyltransferase n=1 Tax=Streptococcus sp. 121 TaxID=2797637 RepID=UPI0018F0F690|nr:phosphatidate cytidylyltransferase [Streptococcus sp. 121]MBJ6746209.1 phosphatidate cytidylyltransferase [Streptococcus sp. 121]
MEKELQNRLLFGVGAAVVLLALLWFGGLPFQFIVGLLAMLGVYELFTMKGLAVNTPEGILATLAALVLALPLENYLSFLPNDSNISLFAVLALGILGSTVFVEEYSYDDAVYPIASAFYLGYGFHMLVEAQMAGLDKVLYALFIVWATDSLAYFVGKRFGQRKLLPQVSPNKTVEGSLGGIAGAMVVTAIYYLVSPGTFNGRSFFLVLLLSIFFSVAGQFGDLVESSIKRHYGVKDSGRFIPGHGGLLDRFDSLLFVFPLLHLAGFF